ncbi:hypothetical protein [Frankia sp. AiPa1]|uniref:hypothetical protein n=1 Tax=Frankia sp. AiPa1 TaxID=573492 RepID=UPI00202B4839|nr:hypothetical protein [Frankia sp. AiPa1]MCL9760258.1 hypothetical protein [Frankia sp. AiPa1]
METLAPRRHAGVVLTFAAAPVEKVTRAIDLAGRFNEAVLYPIREQFGSAAGFDRFWGGDGWNQIRVRIYFFA